MVTLAARVAIAAVLTAAAASAQAQNWQDIPFVSNTVGLSTNRLCLGAPSSMKPSDIGCPSTAPYVSLTAGFVGIGTAEPDVPFDVFASSGAGRAADFTSSYTGTLPRNVITIINMRSNGPGASGIGAQIQFAAETSTEGVAGSLGSIRYVATDATESLINSDITFVNFLAGVGQFPLIIKSSGNVGIGTTSPNAKLDVYGAISATNLILGGVTFSGQNDRIVSGSANVIVSASTGATVSGSLQIAGAVDQACIPGSYGTIRYNQSLKAFQVCRE